MMDGIPKGSQQAMRGARGGPTNEKAGISSFSLKVAAIIGMSCNHLANVFAGSFPDALCLVLYSFGGLTFPIMAFLLVEGYRHSSDLRKYALRLGAFALVSQLPYSLLWGATPNVLWTLLLALGALRAYDEARSRGGVALPLFWVILVLGYFASSGFDWGGIGLVMPLLFYILNERRFSVAVVMLVPLAATLMPAVEGFAALHEAGYDSLAAFVSLFDLDATTQPPFIPCANGNNEILQAGLYLTLFGSVGYALVGFGLATLLLLAYNGRRGRPLKWFFYCYYPAHLALIWLAKLLLEGLAL